VEAGYPVVTQTDIGTAPNEIPLNQYLGDLAYQDSTAVTVGSLTASGNIILSTAGAGIDFSATANSSGTMTSELLSDYEEGTWTPVIEGTTTAGTVTYGNRNARYTKIGRLVTLNAYVSWNSGNGTGNLRMSGLPFAEGGGAVYAAVSLSEFDNINMTAGYYPSAYVATGQSYIPFEQAPTGGGASIAVPYDAAGQVILTVTYST
jgi:hypothetical protein